MCPVKTHIIWLILKSESKFSFVLEVYPEKEMILGLVQLYESILEEH